MMDLVAGFVHSQILMALVELRVLERLIDGPMTLEALAHAIGADVDRATVLLRAGAALGLLKFNGRTVRLTRKGAALTGVPGLSDMIRHHKVLYRDLEDPAAFFRSGAKTELSEFWPYVFGAGAAEDPETAARYSALMTDTQALVAAETLDAVSLAGRSRLMDVGGGTGTFLGHALAATPGMEGILLDLPAVVAAAPERLAAFGVSDRAEVVSASFRDDALPEGADAISLVRVLYDHADDTVRALLAKAYDALPAGGMILISEPLSGGRAPERAGDAYFAVYTMAMGTGRTRSAEEISALLNEAGFSGVKQRRTSRPFVTSVVTASRD